jgi:hypothetical protein
MANTKSTGKSSQKGASKEAVAHSAAHIQLHLHMIAVELRCALSAITVAAHALCKQNADIDADVALVLQRGAGAPVHVGLERIEDLLRELDNKSKAEDITPPDCMH